MRTIAFVTQKGGSGKSTLASSIAVAAMEAGERVCVIDLDPQASLLSWAKTREAEDIAVVGATPTKLPALIEALGKKGVTLVIIDTPGADGAASAAAMREADLNVIPSRPSIFDLWASAQTRAALKATNGDFVFLLSQCPPAQQSARVDAAVEALEEMGDSFPRWSWRASTIRRRRATALASPRSTRTAPRPTRCAPSGGR